MPAQRHHPVGAVAGVRPDLAWRTVLLAAAFVLAVGCLVATVPERAAAALTTCSATGNNNNCVRFTFSGGDQTFVAAKGSTSIDVAIWGGAGGSATIGAWTGGASGYTVGTVAVAPGDELHVTVGGGGSANATDGTHAYGGGGGIPTNVDSQWGSGGGGGLSGLWAGSPFQPANASLIAGGGGGAAANRAGGAVTPAGGGGGSTGGTGGGPSGGAGTQTAGGGVLGGNGCPAAATAGSQLQGGEGAASGRPPGDGLGGETGGAGGGGWFGGGGGRCRPTVNAAPPGGGGGGSGYVGTTGVSAASTLGGDNSNGQNEANRVPYGTENPQYVAGAGASAFRAKGGDGLVAIEFFVPQTLIAAPAAGSITTDTTPVVSGEGSPGTTLTLTDTTTGDTICTTTVSDGGTWTCTPVALEYGDHTLRASEHDPAATYAVYPVSTDVGITIHPPAVVVVDPTDGSNTFEPRPTISGSGADPGATVTVEVGGQTLTAAADDAGAWSVVPSADLAVGDQTIEARQTVDGVDSETTTSAFTVRELPAPTINAPAQRSRTTNRRPVLSGTAEPGATVTLSIAGRSLTVTADSSGRWRTSIGLALGGQSLTVTQTVGSVTSAASPARAFTIVAPPPPPPASSPPPRAPASNDDSEVTTPSPPSAAPQQRGSTATQPQQRQQQPSKRAGQSRPDDTAEEPSIPASGEAPADPNDYLPVGLTVAAATLTPGAVSSFVGTLGPNAAAKPITVSLTGTLNRGVLYRSVESNPAGDCVVTTLSFSCTITLQPGQRATLQIRVLADALNAPPYARQQLSVNTGSATPNTMTQVTRVNTGPTEVSQLAKAITEGPGIFLILLLMYMYALAATEYERNHPRTDDQNEAS